MRADAPVHHVARRDDVGAGARLADGGAREQLDARRRCRRCRPRAAAPQWPWLGVLAEADVGDDEQVGVGLP